MHLKENKWTVILYLIVLSRLRIGDKIKQDPFCSMLKL